MSTGIVITLIICGTIVLLSLIDKIGRVSATKKVTSNLKDMFKGDK